VSGLSCVVIAAVNVMRRAYWAGEHHDWDSEQKTGQTRKVDFGHAMVNKALRRTTCDSEVTCTLSGLLIIVDFTKGNIL
jgi:hypothetical protein